MQRVRHGQETRCPAAVSQEPGPVRALICPGGARRAAACVSQSLRGSHLRAISACVENDVFRPPRAVLPRHAAEGWLARRYPGWDRGTGMILNAALRGGTARLGAYRIAREGNGFRISQEPRETARSGEECPLPMLEALSRAARRAAGTRPAAAVSLAVQETSAAVSAYREGRPLSARPEHDEPARLIVAVSGMLTTR